MIVELSYIKLHSRDCSELEDEVIQSLAESAESMILRYLNRDEAALYEKYGCIPHEFKNAVCMLVNDLNQNREATVMSSCKVNPLFVALIKGLKRHLKYAK